MTWTKLVADYKALRVAAEVEAIIDGRDPVEADSADFSLRKWLLSGNS